MRSAIYTGNIRHRRFQPKSHSFSYPLYMLAIDLDELPELDKNCRHFGFNRFAPLSFRRKDYLDGSERSLKTVALEELQRLGANTLQINQVILLCQVRCFGLYFSPINMFFCYRNDHARYLLVEVNNTPWGERHCYLVNLINPELTQKAFHVSPFLPMDMQYQWHIKPPVLDHPDSPLLVHIEAHQEKRVFDATLTLTGKPLATNALKTALKQWPVMTFNILRSIYWQALKLFLKSIPFIPHPER